MNILYPKYLSQIKLDVYETFRETFCECPTVLKTENNQINKQTNKNLYIFDPKYLCQIKSDLYKSFRETSWWCPMMNKTQNNQTYKQT